MLRTGRYCCLILLSVFGPGGLSWAQGKPETSARVAQEAPQDTALQALVEQSRCLRKKGSQCDGGAVEPQFARAQPAPLLVINRLVQLKTGTNKTAHEGRERTRNGREHAASSGFADGGMFFDLSGKELK